MDADCENWEEHSRLAIPGLCRRLSRHLTLLRACHEVRQSVLTQVLPSLPSTCSANVAEHDACSMDGCELGCANCAISIYNDALFSDDLLQLEASSTSAGQLFKLLTFFDWLEKVRWCDVGWCACHVRWCAWLVGSSVCGMRHQIMLC
jgi:hypothetical protein